MCLPPGAFLLQSSLWHIDFSAGAYDQDCKGIVLTCLVSPRQDHHCFVSLAQTLKLITGTTNGVQT